MPLLSEHDRAVGHAAASPGFPLWFRRAIVAGLVVYWVALLVATHIPSASDEPSTTGEHDKLDHFVAFAGLAFLLVWAWWACLGRLRPWLAIGVVVAYGVLDEWLQGFVPTRVPDVWDWVADVVGAAFGTVVAVVTTVWVLRRMARRPVAQPPAPETPP